jgi:hypothetical protein
MAFLVHEAQNPHAGLELPSDLRERSPLAHTIAAVTYSLLRAFGASHGFDAEDFVSFMKEHRDTIALGVLDLLERLPSERKEST